VPKGGIQFFAGATGKQAYLQAAVIGLGRGAQGKGKEKKKKADEFSQSRFFGSER